MPRYTLESHDISFEPRIWKLLEIIADAIYDGNRSKAVNSIVLFSGIHFFQERAKGRTPDHWMTRAAMEDPAQLDSLLGTIERIATTGVPEEMGQWWAHCLEEKMAGQKCPHCGAVLNEGG